MKLLNTTYTNPAENLACDELLLNRAEEGEEGEVIRFWESQSYFVVLGYSRSAEEDVNLTRCELEGVQVLRRASGGGTVLQGPGCLNYALILKIRPDTPLVSITGTTRYVLERNARALTPFLDSAAEPMGESDLTIRGRKFSGNAQRRLSRFLLFHGTILSRFDIERTTRLLHMPAKQPAYRNRRDHLNFLVNLGIDVRTVTDALQREWNAETGTTRVPHEGLADLVRRRYGLRTWTFRV